MIKNTLYISANILLVFFLFSCSDFQPKDIEYGQEMCDYCNMNIVQTPYAAQMITSKGKILLFDSIECLVAKSIKDPESYKEAHSLWVTDFNTPGSFKKIDEVLFVHGGSIKSPMGVSILAVDTLQTNAGESINLYGGKAVSWSELKKIVTEAWNLK